MSRLKKEGILKAAREKREVTDKGIPTGLKSVDSSTETCSGETIGWSIQNIKEIEAVKQECYP